MEKKIYKHPVCGHSVYDVEWCPLCDGEKESE